MNLRWLGHARDVSKFHEDMHSATATATNKFTSDSYTIKFTIKKKIKNDFILKELIV